MASFDAFGPCIDPKSPKAVVEDSHEPAKVLPHRVGDLFGTAALLGDDTHVGCKLATDALARVEHGIHRDRFECHDGAALGRPS